MSLARQFAIIGQMATAPVENETVLNLANNKTFQAKVYPYAEIGVMDELGPDMRGALTIECMDFTALPAIRPNVQFQIYGQTWTMIEDGDPDTGALHWKIHVKRKPPQDT